MADAHAGRLPHEPVGCAVDLGRGDQDVSATGADGQNYTSTPVPEVDAKRIFEYYPILGQKFNASLLTRDKIPGEHSEDRMIVARFEIPVAKLDARTNLKIRIEDVDGPVSELVEK